ncbi:S-adenosyl-L-methionine-dependent methyltransferase [Gilbertella persicaria]|uniref:S-adenosyl-L-methionine-dependent methyltransferase n=1 Tax=Gilbertella persicaria TaxID=101096 RepID=UPI00221E9A90|nr:S-adenosyl-L-methionine-dependent methyltransferase [Gilbertella persicaria]KAI8084172.1 S-adenosyl-L-methionine-dependent methyltransferase [Gilbertella persicaria]
MEFPEAQDFEASKLGTKTYWDTVYDRENNNFDELGDIGEVWFGEESVERMVEWVTEHVQDPNSRMVDLGCGNGHLLLELAQEGYKQLHGIDYSESAITLAKAVAQQREREWIQYDAVDFISNPEWFLPNEQYDVVLDKGTFDAISLHPDQSQAKKEGVAGPREKYVTSVHRMLKPNGLFLITSCNWTKEELIEHFKQDFEYHSHVKYPVFEFGGQSGSKICTVAFSPKQ